MNLYSCQNPMCEKTHAFTEKGNCELCGWEMMSVEEVINARDKWYVHIESTLNGEVKNETFELPEFIGKY